MSNTREALDAFIAADGPIYMNRRTLDKLKIVTTLEHRVPYFAGVRVKVNAALDDWVVARVMDGERINVEGIEETK